MFLADGTGCESDDDDEHGHDQRPGRGVRQVGNVRHDGLLGALQRRHLQQGPLLRRPVPVSRSYPKPL